MKVATLQSKIYEIRNLKVMLDFDLAALYEIQTKVLNQAVKRNYKRFPIDFMFQLSHDEWTTMRSQFVTASQGKRNIRTIPYAFTEQGVAMLSGILNSDVAINVNIAIMRTFVIIRKHAIEHKDFNEKLNVLETKYDKKFGDIYEALNYLLQKEETGKNQKERKQIGFKKQ
ncbi:ORF6N domain-containing protein [Flavobacterium sp. AS60]|uniref:ORF6N domain-containing protein n=1 Tax=Flavobacterium anseongense TaxID=2910677 RepID=UPI001F1A4F81|nr:ORF6N domain-containing protein [Flavobacterium sp. AS60]MCF6129676.1 ORF6N domain-containing protein [Flavobacterium sp. AS60]